MPRSPRRPQRRYLNYALSVITARALPDVRDGLEAGAAPHPLHDAARPAPARRRQVPQVRGDRRRRDGQVPPARRQRRSTTRWSRMAQHFSLRAPLVDGHGNFGSPDGDAPAAMRYTEAQAAAARRRAARRARPAHGRAAAPTTTARAASRSCCRRASRTCSSTASQGIAVGMATSIPPHNLGEVIDACVALIDEPEICR